MVREQLRGSSFCPAATSGRWTSGTGPGTLALALAPLVGEVVGVDLVPELLEAAGAARPGMRPSSKATRRRWHSTTTRSTSRARAARCTTCAPRARRRRARARHGPGGRVFVDDQIAPVDPLEAFELDRFERRRDPSHNRTLSDGDLRDLFAANGLTLVRASASRTSASSTLPRARGLPGEDAER